MLAFRRGSPGAFPSTGSGTALGGAPCFSPLQRLLARAWMVVTVFLAVRPRKTVRPVARTGAPLARVMFASSTLAVGTIPRTPSRLPAPQHDAQVLERQDFGELSRAVGNAPAGRS